MKSKPVVLVVDDEAINIEFVANLLSEIYDIKVAYSAQQAQKILQQIPVDLILLDIYMPQMDGFEVAKWLQSSSYASIPYIFLTANNDPATLIKGFELGAKDYVTKPFNRMELLARVQNHMHSHLMQEELQQKIKLIKEQQQMLVQQSKVAAMGEMTSMLAHQWRQPLNSIAVLMQEVDFKYSLDLLSKEEMGELTHQIQDILGHMSETIDNFRNFFKPNKERQSFDVVKSMRQAHSILQMKFNNRAIEWRLLEPEEGQKVELTSYEGEFKQVVINLLNNAIEAFENVEVAKPCICSRIEILGDKVVISVEDNAGGISQEMFAHLFEPYQSTKLEKNGTGLGLYMSKTIIEKNMHGVISAKNTERGAHFLIELPLSNEKEGLQKLMS